MKKFLSLVLALVLTMSLVVIPANATEGEGGGGGSSETQDSYVLTVSADENTLYFNGDKLHTTQLTAELTKDSKKVEDFEVEWKSSNEEVATVDGKGKVLSQWKEGTVTITATAKVSNEEVDEDEVTITVEDRFEPKTAPGERTPKVTVGNDITLTAPTLFDKEKSKTVSPDMYSVVFSVDSNGKCIELDTKEGTVTGKSEGTSRVIATITYGNNSNMTYDVEYIITVTPVTLAITLDEVVNGGEAYFYDDDLEDAVQTALDDAVSNYTGKKDVTELYLAKTGVTGGNFDAKSATNLMDESRVLFEATAGFIGDVEFDITAVIDEERYDGTLTIPVTKDDTIEEPVSAVEDGTYTVFTLPSSYDKWYVYTGLSTFRSAMYANNWDGEKVTNWTLYDAGDELKIKTSSLDKNDEATLYVVGLDDEGVASTGELEVALDSYDIEYSGTAGTTITFEQDDFEDMLQEAAKDDKLIGKKNSTASIKFKHVIFEIPGTKEGVLYNGSSKISKSTTKCTDLDKVTFEIASKADSQVYIKFTVYGDYYSSNSAKKPTEEKFRGRVLVKVVHEDIKYTVPVDGSVVFKAEDFQDFYDDTHKNGTLSYVKFTELPKVTDGALYATYSAIYAGTVAKTSDKFYYDSSKASDYDLDDVTFRTSMWSKAGTKIYIPFEAYGTTSKNSKTVSGTPVKGWVAITVENARTMNFTDVKTGDWFYNNVKNAYTMGLIEGKTTTTFNPDDNMTYAEAVTLAARMNQLYYSGKVTLSNSTTGNWYSSYESYAISKGIISSALGNKANTKITRKDYVDIFYNALPASAYTVRNTVSKIPDLANNTANAKVYAFYRAGILTGYANTPGKTNGAFGPNDNIKRSEVATILIRMMDSGTRVYFTL